MIEIFIILLLILLNGVFSLSETAIIASRQSKLLSEIEKGNKQAQKVLDTTESPNRFLSTTQIGITLVAIISGLFGGIALSADLDRYVSRIPFLEEYSSTVSYVIIVILITYLTLVIGELVPKRIGMRYPETIAKKMVPVVGVLSKITAPLVWLLMFSTEGILTLFGMKKSDEAAITEDDVNSMIARGAAAGTFEKVEQDIVERLFFLSDRNVGSLMTNKMEIIALNISDEAQIRQKLMDNPYYTYPVYEDKIDNIIGILDSKTVLSKVLSGKKINYRAVLKVPLFVYDKTEAFRLLELYKEAKTDYAVVIDEFGNFEGVVTFRDFFEALVGEVNLNPNETPEIIATSKNSWLVDGLISFDEFILHFDLPSENLDKKHDFHTLGGFVAYFTKHIPSEGEKFSWQGLNFEIVDMDGLRVDKVLVTK